MQQQAAVCKLMKRRPANARRETLLT